jgi:hypothetical protein
MRRVQVLQITDFIQPLKLRFNNPVALTSFTQILPKLGFTKPTKKDYSIRAWAKFDAENFDGIQIIAALSLNGRDKSMASAEFTVSSVSIDDSWTETSIGVYTGTQAGKKFIASVPQADFGSTALSGDMFTGTISTLITLVFLTKWCVQKIRLSFSNLPRSMNKFNRRGFHADCYT